LAAIAILDSDLFKLVKVKMTKVDHIQARSAQKVFIPSKISNPYLSSFLSLFLSKIFVTNRSAGFSGFAMSRDRRAGTVGKIAD
jgi:hypothetical protein